MGHICELQSFNIHLKTHLEKTCKTKRQATDSGTVADNIRSNSSRQHCFKQSQCLLPSSVRFTGTNRCTVALDLDLICLLLFFLQKLPKFWQHPKPFRFKIKKKNYYLQHARSYWKRWDEAYSSTFDRAANKRRLGVPCHIFDVTCGLPTNDLIWKWPWYHPKKSQILITNEIIWLEWLWSNDHISNSHFSKAWNCKSTYLQRLRVVMPSLNFEYAQNVDLFFTHLQIHHSPRVN